MKFKTSEGLWNDVKAFYIVHQPPEKSDMTTRKQAAYVEHRMNLIKTLIGVGWVLAINLSTQWTGSRRAVRPGSF